MRSPVYLDADSQGCLLIQYSQLTYLENLCSFLIIEEEWLPSKIVLQFYTLPISSQGLKLSAEHDRHHLRRYIAT